MEHDTPRTMILVDRHIQKAERIACPDSMAGAAFDEIVKVRA